jgi:Cdc6-like AAA superfamily ATPase
MNDDQRKIFTYFARIPGMDNQILSAMTAVYQHADEHTSSHGNLAVMGAEGSGKSKLTQDLILAMCLDLGMDAAKVARISGYEMNSKDPARVVSKISGGFLMIEECSEMNDETVASLSKAMDFRTDRMILIIEDEKAAMRGFLKKHPEFAGKIEKVISIPIFTNDELITFARTYAEENQCKIDDMAVLALYTIIGNNQSYEEPMTIARVKSLIDRAITHARKGQKHRGRGRRGRESSSRLVLQEKDFETN